MRLRHLSHEFLGLPSTTCGQASDTTRPEIIVRRAVISAADSPESLVEAPLRSPAMQAIPDRALTVEPGFSLAIDRGPLDADGARRRDSVFLAGRGCADHRILEPIGE